MKNITEKITVKNSFEDFLIELYKKRNETEIVYDLTNIDYLECSRKLDKLKFSKMNKLKCFILKVQSPRLEKFKDLKICNQNNEVPPPPPLPPQNTNFMELKMASNDQSVESTISTKSNPPVDNKKNQTLIDNLKNTLEERKSKTNPNDNEEKEQESYRTRQSNGHKKDDLRGVLQKRRLFREYSDTDESDGD
ncbi:uncharacterized protein VNE69_11015 [Vairimorpha necatrix]